MALIRPNKKKVEELANALLAIMLANFRKDGKLYLTKEQVDSTADLLQAALATKRGTTGGALGLKGIAGPNGKAEYYIVRPRRLNGILAKLGITREEYDSVVSVNAAPQALQPVAAPPEVVAYYEHIITLGGPDVTTFQVGDLTLTFLKGSKITQVVIRYLPPAAALALLIFGLVAIF